MELRSISRGHSHRLDWATTIGLATRIAHGVPAAAKAKIKIKLTVKLSKPPEIGLSIEW